MKTHEDEAAERKRINASLAKIRREENERREQMMVGGGTGPLSQMWYEPTPYVSDGNSQDIPLRWFAIGFVILMVGMAMMMALA